MRASLLLILASVVVSFLAAGCSAKGDLEKICNAEQLSAVPKGLPPDERATHIATWLADNLHSKEGKNVFSALGMVAPAERGNVLREAAKEVGYTGPCPMADAK